MQLTPKQAKKLARLLTSIDRTVKVMDESGMSEFVDNWSPTRGDGKGNASTLRHMLAEFSDWHGRRLRHVNG